MSHGRVRLLLLGVLAPITAWSAPPLDEAPCQIGSYSFAGGVARLDLNGNGVWDGDAGGDASTFVAPAGTADALVADWDADGQDEVGRVQVQDVKITVDRDGDGDLDASHFFGFSNAGPESVPLAGRWAPFVRWRPGFYTGDGDISAGDDVFVLADASQYFPKRRVRFAPFIGPGVPLIGDWNGDLFDELGKVVGTRFILDLDGNDRWDGAAIDRNTSFATAFGVGEPIRGRWIAGGPDRIGVYAGDVFRIDRNGDGLWDGEAGGDWATEFAPDPDGVPIAGRWLVP